VRSSSSASSLQISLNFPICPSGSSPAATNFDPGYGFVGGEQTYQHPAQRDPCGQLSVAEPAGVGGLGHSASP
jgi:hypothetical protein